VLGGGLNFLLGVFQSRLCKNRLANMRRKARGFQLRQRRHVGRLRRAETLNQFVRAADSQPFNTPES
jgi:hypothetical protein